MMVPIVAAVVIVAGVIVLVLARGPVGPTARLAGVVAVLAISALLLPPALAVIGAAALFTLAVVDAIASRPRAAVVAERPRFLARAIASPMRAHIRVPRGARAALRQARVPDVEITPERGTPGLNATIRANRRGRHELPGTAGRVTGPLGLAAWRARPAPDHTITVFPDLPAARRIAAAVRRGRLVSAGLRIRGPIGIGTEFDAIRDYQPDDDIRSVNWRATARTGRPMSNRYRVEQDRDVICLVDCGRLMGAPLTGAGGIRTRLDAALDAVAAMAMVADAVGDRIGVVAFDGEIRRNLTPRRAGSDGVVHAIYDLEPSILDADYELACRHVATSKRALVMVFTDVIDDSAARGLIAGLPRLAAKHAVIIATVRDDDLTSVLHDPPANREDAYRVAAAVEVVGVRAKTDATLTHRGATLVDAPIDQFSAACVRSYLFAKQRALI